MEQEFQSFARFLKILYIALLVPSFANYPLEDQREREAVFKLQFNDYILKKFNNNIINRKDQEFFFLIFHIFLKNPNLEPDGKGFGEPKSLPSPFSKKVKEMLKSLKKKNYLKEFTNSLISIYRSHPYKYRLIIFLCLLAVSSFFYHRAMVAYFFRMRLAYLSSYLIELNSRLRLIELSEKYKKAKFLTPRSLKNLPFHNVPVENSINSFTNLEIEEYKHLETVILENKLRSRLLLYQIFALATELNLNPKATCMLLSIALFVLRLRKDSDSASFILLVKFFLKIFGSTDSSSWTDPNE